MTNEQMITFAEKLHFGFSLGDALRAADPEKVAGWTPAEVASHAWRLRASQRCQLALALLEKHCEF